MKLSTPSTLRSSYGHHLPFFVAYLLFGLLHEFSHVAVASILLSQHPFQSLQDIVHFATRALLGRYCLIEVADASAWARLAILHSGWIFSWALAVGLHYWYIRSSCETSSKRSSSWLTEPIVIVAAYLTGFDAMSTDLFGFVPVLSQVRESSIDYYCCINISCFILLMSYVLLCSTFISHVTYCTIITIII